LHHSAVAVLLQHALLEAFWAWHAPVVSLSPVHIICMHCRYVVFRWTVVANCIVLQPDTTLLMLLLLPPLPLLLLLLLAAADDHCCCRGYLV
jgi:hypothetical protein